jgi:hypothetical protein
LMAGPATRDEEFDFNDVFSLRKPKDAKVCVHMFGFLYLEKVHLFAFVLNRPLFKALQL